MTARAACGEGEPFPYAALMVKRAYILRPFGHLPRRKHPLFFLPSGAPGPCPVGTDWPTPEAPCLGCFPASPLHVFCTAFAALLQRCLQFYCADVQTVFWAVFEGWNGASRRHPDLGGRFAELVRSLALRSAKGASASLPKRRSRAVRGQSLPAFRRKDGTDRPEWCVTNCLQIPPNSARGQRRTGRAARRGQGRRGKSRGRGSGTGNDDGVASVFLRLRLQPVLGGRPSLADA